MFERLREALEAALDSATRHDPSQVTKRMHEAVVEAKTALDAIRSAIAETEASLVLERKNLTDAERRGDLAKGINDDETVAVANRFAQKHRDRVGVLERKLEAQKAELTLGERELGDMRRQLEEARKSQPSVEASDRVEAAWREIEAAGGTRPETDLNDELLRSQFDQATKEAQAQAHLERLKKKMGR